MVEPDREERGNNVQGVYQPTERSSYICSSAWTLTGVGRRMRGHIYRPGLVREGGTAEAGTIPEDIVLYRSYDRMRSLG